MIAIIDYGLNNLRNVQKGFEQAGIPARITSAARDVADAGALVLPGVGAFGDAMANLDELGLLEPLRVAVRAGKPLLGICLGFQLLFEESEEWGLHPGLGFMPGRVVRLNAGNLKVPHMGWNAVRERGDCPLWEGVPDGSYFYFVHSYHAVPGSRELAVGLTEYGGWITAAARRDNVFGVQFHPEKSSRLGLKVLANFGRLASC
ncbi:MAG: imidazole glycerol phosphate synthase subunit HisH [Peptococcaceae bacterium]|nr:imidazole glycerol phosphate synthase subunit HisH [Peptococcaceae bacterium]